MILLLKICFKTVSFPTVNEETIKESPTNHVIDLRHVRDDITNSHKRNIVGDGGTEIRIRLILRSKQK